MSEDKVLMIIAPSEFRDEEYLVPKEIFEVRDLEVITASKGVKLAKGKLGAEVKVDLDISEVKVTDYAAVVLIGGMGALIYENDEVISKILNEAKENYILIGAICIAPRILANNGLLEGFKATAWNGDSKQSKFLEEKGATFVDEAVVEDKSLITANGPEAAKEFGLKIANYILYQ
ncbi:MAG: DJ-1/PfpI family protein [Candidatus Woesearchaeota archaeon]|jgi:protease I|nr:DJ-1/PfpI family protein [Candidatus Woesearchaeota archaeon]